jgi:hypothetical protein
VAIDRRQVRAHRHDGYVAPPSFAPRRDVARPPVLAAAVLLDRFETECTGIPAEADQLLFDPCLDPDCLGLRPARKQEAIPDPGRAVVRSLAEATQPDRDPPFWARQDPGPIDPVVGVLIIDHGLLPQLADQGDLLLLPLAAAAKMPRHFETVILHPVPADADAKAKPAIRKQIDIGGLFCEERRLPLRQDDHTRDQFELLGDAGEVGVGDQRSWKGSLSL